MKAPPRPSATTTGSYSSPVEICIPSPGHPEAVDPSAVTRGASNLDASGQFHFDPDPLAEWRAAHPNRDAPAEYCSPTTP